MVLRTGRGVYRRHKGMKYRPYVPLTEIDIVSFSSIDLDKMTVKDLKALQSRLENLRTAMVDSAPPDSASIEYKFWNRRLRGTEDFLRGVRAFLDRLGDRSGKEPICSALRHLPGTGS